MTYTVSPEKATWKGTVDTRIGLEVWTCGDGVRWMGGVRWVGRGKALEECEEDGSFFFAKRRRLGWRLEFSSGSGT